MEDASTVVMYGDKKVKSMITNFVPVYCVPGKMQFFMLFLDVSRVFSNSPAVSSIHVRVK